MSHLFSPRESPTRATLRPPPSGDGAEARLGPSSIPGIPEPPRGRQKAACRAAPRGGAGAKKLPEVSGGPRRVAGGSLLRSARPREAAPGRAPGSGGGRVPSLLQSNSQQNSGCQPFKCRLRAFTYPSRPFQGWVGRFGVFRLRGMKSSPHLLQPCCVTALQFLREVWQAMQQPIKLLYIVL